MDYQGRELALAYCQTYQVDAFITRKVGGTLWSPGATVANMGPRIKMNFYVFLTPLPGFP